MHQENETIDTDPDSKLPVTLVSSQNSSNNLVNSAENLHNMELTKREGTDSKIRKVHQMNQHNNSDQLIRSRSVDFSKQA